MAFKSYFDGGNEANPQQYKIVTLAAFSGCDIQWKNFERQWKTVLERHHAPWLHTTDAVGVTKEFSKRNGWTEGKISAFIMDCVAVIERCSLKRQGGTVVADGIRGHTISVILADYARTRKENPDLWDATHICAVQCVNCCFSCAHVLGKYHGYHLYFDQNEPFYGHIRDRMSNKKSKNASPGWERVVHVGESNMRAVPALQAADVLAWSVNHNYENGKPTYEWQKRLLDVDRDPGWFDYKRLRRPNREVMETIKSFNLPRRRSPR